MEFILPTGRRSGAAEQIRYISKVKKLGFDILEISCAMLKNISDEKLKELRHEAKAEGVILTAGYGPNASEKSGKR